MITLAVARALQTTLGSNTVTNYDKFVLEQFTYDTKLKTCHGLVSVTSVATPTAQPMTGRLQIVGTELILEIEQANIYKRIVLTAGERQAVDGFIASAQNSLESGLVVVGAVAGTQSTGV